MKLAVKNSDGYKVIYKQVNFNDRQVVKNVVQSVPSDAILYKEGDEFLNYLLNDVHVHVYLVYERGLILGKVENQYFSDDLYTIFEGGSLSVKAAFNPNTMSKEHPLSYACKQE